MKTYRTIPAKTILSKLRGGPDPYFGISYNMNLYRGCQHQCIYCDSRSECYQLGDLGDIRVKENALLILEKELKSKRKKETIGFGSMNDPYMPVEKDLELVRAALKLINKYSWPIHLLTKSNLITRDIDLIKEASMKYSAASLTITTVNDELSKVIEPAAPVSSSRLNAVKKLSDADVYTGVMLMPLLPFINDKWSEIEELIVSTHDHGAKYLLFWPGMTLRDGSREYFYKKLDQHFPGVKAKYEHKFGKDYTCNVPNASNLYNNAIKLCKKLKLPLKMNHFQQPNPEQLSLF